MYYDTGTVYIETGSSRIIGTGTNWAATVCSVGDSISIGANPTSFEITAVISPTVIMVDTVMSTTGSGKTYALTRDYTMRSSLPEIWEYDRDWPIHYTSSINLIDSNLITVSSTRNVKITDDYITGGKFGIGLIIEVKALDPFSFGDLAKWTTETQTGVGAAMESTGAITETATELASAMYIGDEPCAPNSVGKFLLKGIARNDYWNFQTLGGPVYMAIWTEGGITQTAQTAEYYNQTVGIALTKDSMLFSPDFYLT